MLQSVGKIAGSAYLLPQGEGMKTAIITCMCVCLLSGCKLTRVEGVIDDVQVAVGAEQNKSTRGFCPPGQAKKGRC